MNCSSSESGGSCLLEDGGTWWEWGYMGSFTSWQIGFIIFIQALVIHLLTRPVLRYCAKFFICALGMADRNELRVSIIFHSTAVTVKFEKFYFQEKALGSISGFIHYVFPLKLESFTIEELTICFSLFKVQTIDNTRFILYHLNLMLHSPLASSKP